MKIPIFIVDAFIDPGALIFSGNQAAVCVLEGPLGELEMQAIAFEMNLSETAFLYGSKGKYSLRWFTPVSEVDLCGHATLAASHVIWENEMEKKGTSVEFQTKSGLLYASERGSYIELDFPSIDESMLDCPPGLEKALGVKPLYVGAAGWNYLVEVNDEHTVRNIKPDFVLLQSLPLWGTIVTARSTRPEYDFVSRFFAPEKGIMEDPVTGSVHCALGPYWAKKLKKNSFKAYQASKRGGELLIELKNNRVLLSGKAVTVVSGKVKLQ